MVATAAALWASIGIAFAEQYEAVPTNWRLENYVSSHSVKLWFTGAPGCNDGAIEGASLSQDDFGRLWSLILSAKAMNKKVGLFYNASGGVCTINSFFMDQ
jgi:hypothetical protein